MLLYFGFDNNFGHHFFAQHRWDMNVSEETAATDWGRHNCETSISFQPLNSLHPIFWFQDGCCPATLSYHIEHTLFPGVHYLHLKDIAPVIEECAKEFDVPYTKLVGEQELLKFQRDMIEKYATKPKTELTEPLCAKD